MKLGKSILELLYFNEILAILEIQLDANLTLSIFNNTYIFWMKYFYYEFCLETKIFH